ncbi:DUF1731 domain-containing protein [Occultella glacieicola]|uniref:DUF1731 domain-containing protein n=1 Tax=Occultella glacieicola TaxID=2518684 RepID=A0ABY2E9G8_9MICO|nr:DUF1731 domain-containing protein [Occultella glacieicola]TDE99031.1 DUF1731 domain-containing protein [Occultella glacieicola]
MTHQPPAPERPRAVVAGSSGFIGSALIADLRRRGYDVRRVGRSGPDARWDAPDEIDAVVDGADLLVNLAGKSVGCRYHDRNRNEIYRSRIATTLALHRAVARAAQPPRLWLNASTGTIYRHAMDRPQTEAEGELGGGFSVDVARNWERVFGHGDLPRTRRVALRMAIVLGDDGALPMLRTAARFGLGGPEYDGWWLPHRRYRGIGPHPTTSKPLDHHTGGRQRFSWIHIEDVLRAVEFIDTREDLSGPVNLAVPEASDNTTLMAGLRGAVGVPVGLPAPRWLLEIGMLVLRQESELVLKSRWVAPEKLLAAGFEFRHTDLGAALRELA